MIKTAGACPLFTNISATRHKYRGGEIQIQIFCGLIAQIKLVNHGSTGEEQTPATRVITNTAAYRPRINVAAIHVYDCIEYDQTIPHRALVNDTVQ